VKSRISGKEAVYVARESERRRPVKLLVSRSVHASTINAWHLRPIWRATEHAYVKPSANSCRMSSSTCEGQFGTEVDCCEITKFWQGGCLRSAGE
jgi:hypothetical protein